jgi:hypothetical protein
MSDQGAQHDQVDYDDLPDDVDPEVVEHMQAQLAAVQQSNFENAAMEFLEEFPAYREKDAAEAFVAEAHQRAEALGAPHLGQSPVFWRQLAVEAAHDEQAEKQAYERSDEGRIDRIFQPGAGSRVLPFG